MTEGWILRRAADADGPALHDLLTIPHVYRYLADGVPPPRPVTDGWIARSHVDFATHGVGLWLLAGDGGLDGCVLLQVTGAAAAELIYALHPRRWGSGLATRMSWTVMTSAFAGGAIDEIVAGADEPNVASIAVMRRLGMTFLRPVTYELGPGVEYRFRRGDPASVPLPERIPLAP